MWKVYRGLVFKVRLPFVKCVLLFYRINLLNQNSRLCHMYKMYGVHNTLIGVPSCEGIALIFVRGPIMPHTVLLMTNVLDSCLTLSSCTDLGMTLPFVLALVLGVLLKIPLWSLYRWRGGVKGDTFSVPSFALFVPPFAFLIPSLLSLYQSL